MAKVKGFFTSEQLHSVGINGPSSGECEECGLYHKCKSPRMTYAGQGKKGILIVGQQPSASADRTGDTLQGEATELLRKRILKKGINLDVDCWKIDAIACNTGTNDKGKPNPVERKHLKCCRPRLMKAIADLKPRHIWLMGDDAVASYFMGRENSSSISRWRALCIPDVEKQAWIVPLYHPNFILLNEKDDHLSSTFDRDLTFAIKCSKFTDPPEEVPLNKCITLLKTYEEVVRELKRVLELEPPKLAFDYETNSKKPYRKECKIASMSWCYSYDRAFACPYEYRKHFTVEQLEHIGDLWIEILSNPRIKKIAHNSKFEDMWTRAMFGIDITNLWWCSMITSHIQDNRSQFSGLKFQALIRWGVPDYDADIEKYLESTKESPFNRVMEINLNDLLLYGGIDSLLTFRLQEEQEEELAPYTGLQKARVFFMEGLHTLCDIQENGIPISRKYYSEKAQTLGKDIESMWTALHEFPEALRFKRIKGRPINFTSDFDLRELFFKILELPMGRLTGTGMGSVDAAVLASLNTPIAKEITRISKLEKVHGTYLGQFNREIEDDDKLHPFFDLTVPVTYRGSSSDPNFQNIPVRDEEAKIITRSGIIPSLLAEYVGCAEYPDYIGNQLIDWDYGAMEVRIIACYTQDPVLMAYIFDESTDMHRDMAIELFKFQDTWQSIPGKLGKKIRFEAKNGATFPWFYGSYYRSVAKNLFAKCMDMICYDGITVFEHLRAVGIIKNKGRAYEEFEAHIKKAEERFWHKFKAVKAWQERAWKDYLAKGYIEQKFGFRCSGWLSRNDVVNYPIQGTAFHCLMWAINRINKQMKEQRMLSRMIGQIHDCCLSDLFPPERHQLITMSERIATKEIREENPWICVPLLIEWEEAAPNKSWADKIEIRED